MKNINKICLKCGKEKNIEEFSILKKGRLGKHPNCNECRRIYENDRYKNGKVRKIPYNYSKQLKKYGLTLEEYSEMIIKQEEKCLICHEKKILVVDHNHKTGKVRGLLCQKCNKGLGLFNDTPIILLSAFNYLLNNK